MKHFIITRTGIWSQTLWTFANQMIVMLYRSILWKYQGVYYKNQWCIISVSSCYVLIVHCQYLTAYVMHISNCLCNAWPGLVLSNAKLTWGCLRQHACYLYVSSNWISWLRMVYIHNLHIPFWTFKLLLDIVFSYSLPLLLYCFCTYVFISC